MTDGATVRPRLSIVVPCFDEGGNAALFPQKLLPVARRLAADWDVELVLVDDGSRDDTLAQLEGVAASAKDLVVRVVAHGRNRGLGAAIRTGFAESTGDVVVTTDSDGTYSFDEIPRLLAFLEPDVDVVTASPYHPEGSVENVPAYRLVLSRGASLLYRVFVDRRLHTYTALFRAYRRRVLDGVSFESDDFLSCAEILVNAIQNGFRVAEAPMVLRSRAIGTSKARLARIVRSHLRFQARVVASRLGGLVSGGARAR